MRVHRRRTPITHYPLIKAPTARYVAVCRQAYAPVRDDVVIDAIQATCQ